MLKQLFTHALDIQADSIPPGYVPVGTQESLNALYENLKGTGQDFSSLSFYTLKSEPPLRKPELTAEFIKTKAEQLIDEGTEIRIAPAEIKKTVHDIKTPAVILAKGLKKIMDKATKEGKAPEVMDLLPIALAGKKLGDKSKGTITAVRKGIDKTLHHQNDENVIVNEEGVFVSKEWLLKPENASLHSVFKFSPKAPQLH